MEKEVFKTNDYSKFTKLNGNRRVDEARVLKIISSIEKVGYITSPIIVNEKMEVIDGQGRLEALKRLELPVEYIIQQGIGIEECIAMNIHQVNWKDRDYIESYANRGFESYRFLKELLDKYKETFKKKNIKVLIQYIDSWGHKWTGKVAWPKESKFIEFLNKRLEND